LVFSFYFSLAYKNLSLYRKGSLSNTDLYFEYIGEVEFVVVLKQGMLEDWGEGPIILIRSERRPKTFCPRWRRCFGAQFFLIERVRGKGEERAGVVLKIYERMGYDALNIGDTDLGLGVAYLRPLQKNRRSLFSLQT